MKRKIMSLGVFLTLVFGAFAIAPWNAIAVEPEDIEEAIEDGIAWLITQQDSSTGAWQDVPRTGFVLIKLQDRANELGLNPFETDPEAEDYYEYSTNVIDGWEYLFSLDEWGSPLYAWKPWINTEDHTLGASGTIDDPDTRVNGFGISFQGTVYYTGICLMALAASGDPNHVNEGGIDYNGDSSPDTFGEIAQDVVDWLAWAQADVGIHEGGYSYGALDDACYGDNSNAGYAYLGLAAAEGFGCTVPQWVRDELNVWIDWVQNDQGTGDDAGQPTPDGGSGYEKPTRWVNELKTGNLIFEMIFYGDDTNTQRFQYAIDYIQRHWNDANLQPGFRGDAGIDDDGDTLIDEDPYEWPEVDNDGDGKVNEDMGLSNHYQAMYCLMKGFEYSNKDFLDLDGDDISEHDWFDEFATMLLDDQNPDGSWPSSPCYVWTDGHPGPMSGEILSTIWALLTLEKISPPPPMINVYLDIKPSSCPNPINPKSKGVLPVAICGTEDFDVTTIDPDTIQLTREGVEVYVDPIKWSHEDVATPFEGELCDCHELEDDGYTDFTLKFKIQEVKNLLSNDDLDLEITLTIIGNLKEEHGGTAIEGQDCVWVIKPLEKNEENSHLYTRPIYQLVEIFSQQFPNLFPILRQLLRIG